MLCHSDKKPSCLRGAGLQVIACALVVLASLGLGAAHAESALDLVEIRDSAGLEHGVYANYATRSGFASVSAPSDSTAQVRFAAFGQDITLANPDRVA